MAYAPSAASAAPGSRAHDVTVSSGEQAAALAFWTPQRLAAAQDADALAVPAPETAAPRHPGRIGPLHPSVVPPALPNASVRSSGREWHPYYGREAHDAYLAADAA